MGQYTHSGPGFVAADLFARLAQSPALAQALWSSGAGRCWPRCRSLVLVCRRRSAEFRERKPWRTTPQRRSTQPVFMRRRIGAIAHLDRGEVYRSTVWRTGASMPRRTGPWWQWASPCPSPSAALRHRHCRWHWWACWLPCSCRSRRGDIGSSTFLVMLRSTPRAPVLRPDPARARHPHRQWLERDPLQRRQPPEACTSA